MDTNGKIQGVQLAVAPGVTVSAILGIPEWWPSGHRAGVVLAHDTGQDMKQDLLIQLQELLTDRGFLNIRFNFPYAEQGKKRPDPLPLLERTYRTAALIMQRDPEEAPAMMVLAGIGLGAKVASSVIASGLKADGLVCIAYPLHPAGKPNQQKPDALFRIICPILFVQGSRDANCRVDRLETLRRRIGAPTQVSVIEDADHGLIPVKRSKRTPEEVSAEVLSSVGSYLQRTIG